MSNSNTMTDRPDDLRRALQELAWRLDHCRMSPGQREALVTLVNEILATYEFSPARADEHLAVLQVQWDAELAARAARRGNRPR